jgi:hypothetical protein
VARRIVGLPSARPISTGNSPTPPRPARSSRSPPRAGGLPDVGRPGSRDARGRRLRLGALPPRSTGLLVLSWNLRAPEVPRRRRLRITPDALASAPRRTGPQDASPSRSSQRSGRQLHLRRPCGAIRGLRARLWLHVGAPTRAPPRRSRRCRSSRLGAGRLAPLQPAQMDAHAAFGAALLFAGWARRRAFWSHRLSGRRKASAVHGRRQLGASSALFKMDGAPCLRRQGVGRGCGTASPSRRARAALEEPPSRSPPPLLRRRLRWAPHLSWRGRRGERILEQINADGGLHLPTVLRGVTFSGPRSGTSGPRAPPRPSSGLRAPRLRGRALKHPGRRSRRV